MLRSLARFVADLAGGGRGEEPFGAGDYRLAAAALLLHLVQADGDASEAEIERLEAVLAERFGLDEAGAEELVETAIERDREAVDLYAFTSVLNRTLDETERRRIVEMMWEVVFADGDLHEIEDNIVWRAADLLHVPARDRIALRRQVADRDAPAEE